MAKIILGFTGEAGSGKDAAARYLADRHGAQIHTFSTVLRDILKRLYLPVTRQNIVAISGALRGKFGEGIIGEVIMKDIAEYMHPLLVVTGIRRPPDMTGFKGHPGFHLVYIESSPEVRYARIKGRNQNQDDATKSYDEFLNDEQLETERGIKDLKPLAEMVVENNGSVEELHKKLDQIVGKLGYG